MDTAIIGVLASLNGLLVATTAMLWRRARPSYNHHSSNGNPGSGEDIRHVQTLLEEYHKADIERDISRFDKLLMATDGIQRTLDRIESRMGKQ